jgi:hypothetical protein
MPFYLKLCCFYLQPCAVILIENHLLKAIDDNITASTALVMLGAVKFDFYVVNGLKEENPTFLQISKELQNLNFCSIDFQFLFSVQR